MNVAVSTGMNRALAVGLGFESEAGHFTVSHEFVVNTLSLLLLRHFTTHFLLSK